MIKKLLIVILILVSATVFTQNREDPYHSELLDSFDDPDSELQWLIRGSRHILNGFPKQGYLSNWPIALHGWTGGENSENLRVLGIEAGYSQKGYNYLEIIPGTKNENGEFVEQLLALPRNVVSVDMWVWGSNHAYQLEVQLRDYRGIIHTLPFGSLQYHGWKNLRLDIPGWLTQKDPYSLHASELKIVKFVLWTQPRERVNNFYLYFDNLSAVMSGHESILDGGVLSDKELRDELWSDIQGGNE